MFASKMNKCDLQLCYVTIIANWIFYDDYHDKNSHKCKDKKVYYSFLIDWSLDISLCVYRFMKTTFTVLKHEIK